MINRSDDKDRVLRDAFCVLEPGGRFAASDAVVRGLDDPTDVAQDFGGHEYEQQGVDLEYNRRIERAESAGKLSLTFNQAIAKAAHDRL